MAKERVSPTQVRFDPEVTEAIRALATARNSTMSAEITRLVEDGLRSGNHLPVGKDGVWHGDPTLIAIKTMTLAALDASYGELGSLLGKEFVLRQFKTAMDDLFDALRMDALDAKIGHAAALKVLNEMRAGGDTPLGAAGRTLGLAKEKKQ